MPETKDTSSFFTYYDVTEKIAIVIGMFTFGFVGEILSMKYSVLFLIIFFAVGFVLLYATLMNERKIKATAPLAV